jgi:hypothetical protein
MTIITVVSILHKEAVARDGSSIGRGGKFASVAADRWKIPTNRWGFSRERRFAL